MQTQIKSTIRRPNFINRQPWKKNLSKFLNNKVQMRISMFKSKDNVQQLLSRNVSSNTKIKKSGNSSEIAPFTHRVLPASQQSDLIRKKQQKFRKSYMRKKFDISVNSRVLTSGNRQDSFELPRCNTNEQTRKRTVTQSCITAQHQSISIQVMKKKMNQTNFNKMQNPKQKINYNKFLQITPFPRPTLSSFDPSHQLLHPIMSLHSVHFLPQQQKSLTPTTTISKKPQSEVKQAESESNKYIIKIYKKQRVFRKSKKQRIMKQIQILSSIQKHANIIHLIDAYENKTQIHLIFEYIEQFRNLEEYFRIFCGMQGSREILLKKVIVKVCKGVLHLHANGVAHRDLKPDNVIVGLDQDGLIVVKIIDFGVATNLPKTDLHCGTPNFMAPELLTVRNKDVNLFAADIWALGIMMFYLSEGQYPFSGLSQVELYNKIKQGKYNFKRTECENLKNIIRSALEMEPQKRIKIQELLKNPWFYNN